MEKFLHVSRNRVSKYLLVGGLLFSATAACDHGLAPVGHGSTGLHGRITLLGQWPPETGIVAVALFKQKPTTPESDLPVAWKTAPADSSWFDYQWVISGGGGFGYLVVAWLREGDSLFDLDAWVELGFYADPVAPEAPGEILITPGEFLRIDLAGDFSKVPSQRRFTTGVEP